MFKGLWAVLKKELFHLRKDPLTLVLAFLMPIVETIGFGSAVSTAPRQIPLAVYDEDHSRSARDLVTAFMNSSYFRAPLFVADPDALERCIRTGRAKAGLHIPPHFSTDRDAGKPTRVQLLLDGLEYQYAGSALKAAGGIESTFAVSAAPPPAIEIAPLLLYNRQASPALFTTSGLLALILTQCAIALSSLTLVREKETGSFEQIIVTPITRGGLIAGKLLPYALISAVDGLLVIGLSLWLFESPFRGSALLLAALSVLFFLAVLGYGLFISAVARNSTQALLLALILVFPPIFFSGFDAPLSLAPPPIQVLGMLFPMTFYLNICRGIMVRGLALADLWPDVIGLIVQSLVLYTFTAWRFRKTLG